MMFLINAIQLILYGIYKTDTKDKLEENQSKVVQDKQKSEKKNE
jgi:hypothetical protein